MLVKIISLILGITMMSLASAQALQTNADTKHTGLISPEILTQYPQWGLVRTGQACIEYYQFRNDGEVMIRSNQERILGRFIFLNNSSIFELAAVKIEFLNDNGKPDCTGDSTNQTNQSTINYLKRKSDREIYFCDDSLGKSCPVYLRAEN